LPGCAQVGEQGGVVERDAVAGAQEIHCRDHGEGERDQDQQRGEAVDDRIGDKVVLDADP
jgi:hypothetical protein